MLLVTAASSRMRQSAGRLLGRFGFRTTFQRYAKTKDWDRGGESHSAAGNPVTGVRCRYEEITKTVRGESGGVRETRTVLCVEHEPFEDLGGLDETWRYIDPETGDERTIPKAVLNPEGTFYLVEVSDHGR